MLGARDAGDRAGGGRGGSGPGLGSDPPCDPGQVPWPCWPLSCTEWVMQAHGSKDHAEHGSRVDRSPLISVCSGLCASETFQSPEGRCGSCLPGSTSFFPNVLMGLVPHGPYGPMAAVGGCGPGTCYKGRHLVPGGTQALSRLSCPRLLHPLPGPACCSWLEVPLPASARADGPRRRLTEGKAQAA